MGFGLRQLSNGSRTNRAAVAGKQTREEAHMPSNKALQTDKVNLSRLLHAQESRQLAFAAELGR
jgi:hypothetical protein